MVLRDEPQKALRVRPAHVRARDDTRPRRPSSNRSRARDKRVRKRRLPLGFVCRSCSAVVASCERARGRQRDEARSGLLQRMLRGPVPLLRIRERAAAGSPCHVAWPSSRERVLRRLELHLDDFPPARRRFSSASTAARRHGIACAHASTRGVRGRPRAAAATRPHVRAPTSRAADRRGAAAAVRLVEVRVADAILFRPAFTVPCSEERVLCRASKDFKTARSQRLLGKTVCLASGRARARPASPSCARAARDARRR